MRTIKENLERDYVTQDQFEPIKKVVYGLVSIILVSVVMALIALVVIK
jgi:ABC-type phosphate transport system permease subunit